MGGRDEKGNKKGEGGGGWGTFWKVAAAAAATVVVAGSLYSALKQPEPEQPVAGGTGGSGSKYTKENEEEEEISVWTKPMVGWMKLNVDGSLLPHSAGCGGVLRGSSGNWIAGFAQKLNPNSKVDETEKEAIFRGLQWAKRNGVRKVVVESDNKGVVDAVNSGRRSNDALVRDIRELLGSPHWEEEPKLTWIRRKDANEVADKVADNAHRLPSFDLREYGPYDIPQNCRDAYLKDMQRVSSALTNYSK